MIAEPEISDANLAIKIPSELGVIIPCIVHIFPDVIPAQPVFEATGVSYEITFAFLVDVVAPSVYSEV